jgi:hypothetical protein
MSEQPSSICRPTRIQPFLSFLKTAVPKTPRRGDHPAFAPEDVSRVAAAVAALAARSREARRYELGHGAGIIPLGALSDLAARGDVQWLEEHPS